MSLPSPTNLPKPTPEQWRQYIVSAIVPILAGAIVSWLSSDRVINVFHLNEKAVESIVSELLVFAITAGITWLSTHHILSGKYESKPTLPPMK
jgi:hypothetical protein